MLRAALNRFLAFLSRRRPDIFIPKLGRQTGRNSRSRLIGWLTNLINPELTREIGVVLRSGRSGWCRETNLINPKLGRQTWSGRSRRRSNRAIRGRQRVFLSVLVGRSRCSSLRCSCLRRRSLRRRLVSSRHCLVGVRRRSAGRRRTEVLTECSLQVSLILRRATVGLRRTGPAIGLCQARADIGLRQAGTEPRSWSATQVSLRCSGSTEPSCRSAPAIGLRLTGAAIGLGLGRSFLRSNSGGYCRSRSGSLIRLRRTKTDVGLCCTGTLI
jgi:hypothetical protein